MSTAQPKVTKQSVTRLQVLDLIERLGVGAAIPSERQLSADLGVSRLTVRAALDDLAREGHVVRRRGSGTYVQQPKIAQELTMTSFSEDMRRREGGRRAAAFAGAPLRAAESRRARRDRRVRPVGLSGRPVPDRHRAQPPPWLSPLDNQRSCVR